MYPTEVYESIETRAQFIEHWTQEPAHFESDIRTFVADVDRYVQNALLAIPVPLQSVGASLQFLQRLSDANNVEAALFHAGLVSTHIPFQIGRQLGLFNTGDEYNTAVINLCSRARELGSVEAAISLLKIYCSWTRDQVAARELITTATDLERPRLIEWLRTHQGYAIAQELYKELVPSRCCTIL